VPLPDAGAAQIDENERLMTDARKHGENERRLAYATSGILHVGLLAAGTGRAQTSA
jgi:hypothetical protein